MPHGSARAVRGNQNQAVVAGRSAVVGSGAGQAGGGKIGKPVAGKRVSAVPPPGRAQAGKCEVAGAANGTRTERYRQAVRNQTVAATEGNKSKAAQPGNARQNRKRTQSKAKQIQIHQER